MDIIKLHKGDINSVVLLNEIELLILNKAQGMSIPAILGVLELAKDLVKEMDMEK